MLKIIDICVQDNDDDACSSESAPHTRLCNQSERDNFSHHEDIILSLTSHFSLQYNYYDFPESHSVRPL